MRELYTAEVPVPTDEHAGVTVSSAISICGALVPSGANRDKLGSRTYLPDASVTTGAQRGAVDHSVTNADGSGVVLSPETKRVREQAIGQKYTTNGGLRGVQLTVLSATI